MDTKQTSLLKVVAEHTKNFCLEITESGIRLKQKHSYYKQVQGGMAITRKPGCDFDAYTYFMNREDIHIEIIFFDPTFWQVPRKSFLTYLYAMVPELLTGCVERNPYVPKHLFQ